jgi:multidrug efflux system outer membrane protein
LQAQVVIATEQQARLVARYGAVALAAFWEVENALAAEPFLAAQLPLEQKSLASRQDAVRIATVQYTAGRRDLLWVSQLQAGALQTEAGVIRLGSTLLVNRVRLAQALGSSYDGTPAAAIGGPLAAASPSAGAGS